MNNYYFQWFAFILGVLPEALQLFLEKNMPKNNAILGISDPKMASGISDTLKVKCQATGVVPEILRGN